MGQKAYAVKLMAKPSEGRQRIASLGRDIEAEAILSKDERGTPVLDIGLPRPKIPKG